MGVKMISFELTKEQELVLNSAKEFAAKELKEISRDCDEDGAVPMKVLNKAWEIGLANAAVPEAYGGIGMERSFGDQHPGIRGTGLRMCFPGHRHHGTRRLYTSAD